MPAATRTKSGKVKMKGYDAPPEEDMQGEEMRMGTEEEEPMETKDKVVKAKKNKAKKDGEGGKCDCKKGRKKMDSLTAGHFRMDLKSKKCGGGYISASKKCRKGSSSHAQEAKNIQGERKKLQSRDMKLAMNMAREQDRKMAAKKAETIKAEKAYAKKPKSFARKAAGAYLKVGGALGTAGGLINAGIAASQGNFASTAGYLGAARASYASYKSAKRGKLGRSLGQLVGSSTASYAATAYGMFGHKRKKRDGGTYAAGFKVDYSRLAA